MLGAAMLPRARPQTASVQPQTVIATGSMPPPDVPRPPPGVPLFPPGVPLPPPGVPLPPPSVQLPTIAAPSPSLTPPPSPSASGSFPLPGLPPVTPAPSGVSTRSRPGTDFPLDGAFATRPGASVSGLLAPEIVVGQELGGYTIQRKLAEGGMGMVYEAVHTRIGRRGAIKVLKLELCRSKDVIQRFRQEAQAVNEIRHENIVDIYDWGEDAHGRAFFVMEYLEGEPLSARVRRGALPWVEAFPILDQTLRALKAAHDKGFIHRDLKPDNIWLKYVDGRVLVKLLDFGIAKLVGSESPREKLTQTGSVIGTPHYMSPEQINGSRSIDHRTDIYAMGVIIYELFAGITPFVGDTLQAIMTGHLFKEPPRLTEVQKPRDVPAPIAEIVDRMLVKDAAGRYDSVADVLEDLHDVNAHQRPARAATLSRAWPTRAPGGPAPIAPPTTQPRSRLSRAIVLAALIVAGLAAGGVAIWKRQQRGAAAVDPEEPRAPKDPETPPKPKDLDGLRKDAYTILRNALRSSEPTVRIPAADALGKLGHRASLPLLTELVQKDPDQLLRGHVAEALAAIGDAASAPLLAQLEAAAPAPLKVYYASTLARLGDARAHDRLAAFARDPDLAVSLQAGLSLADLSRPGDARAIKALTALVAQEAKLNQIRPYAGAMLLTKLAALRHAEARKILLASLDHSREGARLAAAEGLATLGDAAGRKPLLDVLASSASPENRLVAAVALVRLGDHSGLDVITAKLGAKDLETAKLAARALGDLGAPASLPSLIPLLHDQQVALRVAAAAAIAAILRLDPQELARAALEEVSRGLHARDLPTRKAAAGALGDLPEQEALPLLAQALADEHAEVRLEAARSAGRLKLGASAGKIADAALKETDARGKEQLIRALGQIGSLVGRRALLQLARERGRLGVLASGALIAVGELSGRDALEAAIRPTQPAPLRLAAMEAAAAAGNPIVEHALLIGVADRVFDVRFAAAEGLAGLHTGQDAALPVLLEGLKSKDLAVYGRAIAALIRIGEPLGGKAPAPAPTPAELLDAVDQRLRLAVASISLALPPAEAAPLLRRLIADPDPDVRRAGLDAIARFASTDKARALELYRLRICDPDPFLRAKVQGQLSRLISR